MIYPCGAAAGGRVVPMCGHPVFSSHGNSIAYHPFWEEGFMQDPFVLGKGLSMDPYLREIPGAATGDKILEEMPRGFWLQKEATFLIEQHPWIRHAGTNILLLPPIAYDRALRKHIRELRYRSS